MWCQPHVSAKSRPTSFKTRWKTNAVHRIAGISNGLSMNTGHPGKGCRLAIDNALKSMCLGPGHTLPVAP